MNFFPLGPRRRHRIKAPQWIHWASLTTSTYTIEYLIQQRASELSFSALSAVSNHGGLLTFDIFIIFFSTHPVRSSLGVCVCWWPIVGTVNTVTAVHDGAIEWVRVLIGSNPILEKIWSNIIRKFKHATSYTQKGYKDLSRDISGAPSFNEHQREPVNNLAQLKFILLRFLFWLKLLLPSLLLLSLV